MRIINNSDTVLSTAAQQSIRNAVAELGLDEVIATRTNQYEEGEIYDIYDNDDNYLFSIDSPDGVIFEK